jgi:hypothetical protein
MMTLNITQQFKINSVPVLKSGTDVTVYSREQKRKTNFSTSGKSKYVILNHCILNKNEKVLGNGELICTF